MYKKSNEVVYHYWLPRSGGTFIWQVLKELFNNVKSTHDTRWIDTKYPLVIVYRDFRDVTFSLWRVTYGKYNSKDDLINQPKYMELAEIIKAAKDRIKILNLYRDNHKSKRVLYLRYEKFFNNYDYLFKTIEEFFKITIPEEKKKEIIKRTNFEKNKERASKIKGEFGNFIRATKIHAHHVYSSKLGMWKEKIPLKFHQLLNEKLAKVLKEWKYKVDYKEKK